MTPRAKTGRISQPRSSSRIAEGLIHERTKDCGNHYVRAANSI